MVEEQRRRSYLRAMGVTLWQRRDGLATAEEIP
jgi:hypothetical protein